MDKKDVIKKMADQFSKIKIEKEVRIMEVCGTHTTEFFKTGVKDIFPEICGISPHFTCFSFIMTNCILRKGLCKTKPMISTPART